MREFIVDVAGLNSFDSFVEAFNIGFCEQVDGRLHSMHLDAFHDLLSWPEEEHYRLVFKGWESCLPLLTGIHEPTGKTYLENLHEIFADNPQVEVVFT